MSSKFEKVFEGYSSLPSYDEITNEVNKILNTHFDGLNNKKTMREIHGCVDLTSLNSTDSEDTIYNLVKSINELDENDPSIPAVAAICVYPNFVKIVKENLTTEGVSIACVSGSFPSSQTFPEVKEVEAGLALEDGADELDIVIRLGDFLNGNYQEVFDDIHEIRELARGRKLKVILETGALQTPENIQRASIIALFAGANFIKTSTGKEFPGASLEACYVMCKVLKDYERMTGEKRGIKVSGGIRSTEEAIKYYCLTKEILGEEYLNKDHFRIGASSLVKDLHKHLK